MAGVGLLPSTPKTRSTNFPYTKYPPTSNINATTNEIMIFSLFLYNITDLYDKSSRFTGNLFYPAAELSGKAAKTVVAPTPVSRGCKALRFMHPLLTGGRIGRYVPVGIAPGLLTRPHCRDGMHVHDIRNPSRDRHRPSRTPTWHVLYLHGQVAL